jgi:hypothetical protein
MKPVLCIDFGTSSIRATVRKQPTDIRVLQIGEITNSRSIDGASIRSDICIKNKNVIQFGERAYETASKTGERRFYVASPKLWLGEPGDLIRPVIPGLPITRRDLIAGLLAYALFAAEATGHVQLSSEPADIDLRIAHPVWPEGIQNQSMHELYQIGYLALEMATAGDWGETSPEILKSWTTPGDTAFQRHSPAVDTLEPVAAAVELLPTTFNSRRVCVVVDVGAGTTDLGVFQALTPFERSSQNAKLIPTGPTVSVFSAGNDIDATVLRLLKKHNPEKYTKNRVDLESRIRSLKETLFKQGHLETYGISLSLEELERSTEMVSMANLIRTELERCLDHARLKLEVWHSPRHYPADRYIGLVMAGGGAELAFLRNKLSGPVEIRGCRYELRIIAPNPPPNLAMHGAGYARLAVALGGVSPIYETVIHEYEKLTGYASLGSPKQIISGPRCF